MRILFAITATCVYPSVRGLCHLLKSHRHDVKVVYRHKNKTDVDIPFAETCWSEDTAEIDKFLPDRVIVWNGFFPEYKDSCEKIFSTYKDRARIVELGWLPQKTTLYMAETMVHASKISDVPFEAGRCEKHQPLLEELKRKYTPAPIREPLPNHFVFFPAQLDHDTTILWHSPRFKSTNDAIRHAQSLFPGMHILVKNHPLQLDAERPAGTILYKGSARAVDLMARAELVVGINSTCLTEALVLGKPVLPLGVSPGRLAMLKEEQVSVKNGQLKIEGVPSREEMDYRVLTFALNQFNAERPESWTSESIVAEKFEPRVP